MKDALKSMGSSLPLDGLELRTKQTQSNTLGGRENVWVVFREKGNQSFEIKGIGWGPIYEICSSEYNIPQKDLGTFIENSKECAISRR